MKKVLVAFLLLLGLTGLFGFAHPQIAQAATQAECNAEKRQTLFGIPKWYRYLEIQPDPSGRCTPTVENSRAALPIGIAILEMGLRLAGLIAVVMVFIGSFKFITSAGSGDAAASARKTVINALIGLVIVIISTGVVSFLGSRLG